MYAVGLDIHRYLAEVAEIRDGVAPQLGRIDLVRDKVIAFAKRLEVFLEAFAETIGDEEHVALVLDSAGPARQQGAACARNIRLVPLPPYSPELNPVERVWLYLKERFLSLRLHNDYQAIVAAASKAWRRLCRQTGRLASLTAYPWIMKVKP
jgi:transposase